MAAYRLRAAGWVLAGFALTGCALAPPGSQDPGPTPVERLSNRVSALEEQLVQLRQAQQKQAERSAELRKTLESLTVENGDLQEAVRKVRGETEVLGHRLEKLDKRQRQLYGDLDSRLRALESGAGNGSGGAGPAAEPVPEFDSAQAAYDAAYAKIEENQYRAAVRYFQAFLERHPNSDLVPNAYYWLGEAHYVRREFQEALVAFNKVLEQYPDSNKAAAALLKVGFSFYELEDMEGARQALERVVERFPDSSEARLAKRRLDKIPSGDS
jgi:tol-pal system protein YbgF